MTVCIAAECEHGNIVVATTDGALSYAGVTSDTGLSKAWWMDDWLFMYAGAPSNADLILEQIRQQLMQDKDCLTRPRIRETVRTAYRKHLAHWASDAVLSPFDLDIDTFKQEGPKVFGEQWCSEIALAIRDRAQQYEDQLLVIGWGASERSAMIHEENRDGSVSHSMIGLAAIGSGGPTATSQMLLLGHNSSLQLEDTIYSVAAAKFAAEQASGVGKSTTMIVTWQRRESDAEDRTPTRFIQKKEIDKLREIWEQDGRPKIPFTRYGDLTAITRSSEIPNDVRSKEGAVSEARWKAFNDGLSKLKPGESIGF